MELYFIALVILAGLAVSDLIVGVSNDAVNFLNSAIGSRVASRKIILIIASLGMIAGVLFSKGMMEVARKGIFHPQLFNMPELMSIFLAVMLTDVLLLDFYNTFGLPTSTTVSLLFELLGAAVAVSVIKASQAHESATSIANYINTTKVLAFISGILISVAVAFFCGMVFQFISRLIFTFDFQKRVKRFGAIYGGLALSFIIYFIVIKGAKGAAFLTPDALSWIQDNSGTILLVTCVVCAIVLQLLIFFSRLNVLRPIVLIGTFALAMAFAANDLVNFIGVPLAGMSAYQVASSSATPLTLSMDALQQGAPSYTPLLLMAGVVMVITLWVSKKARTVTATEVNLSRQEEGFERFGSTYLSRTIVRNVSNMIQWLKKVIPGPLHDFYKKRYERNKPGRVTIAETADGDKPSYDLVRASVNLMVASALISFATSLKLPLSTTYVTFMVAMGSSFADHAWGRDSAVFRVTGVLIVIGGWFLTAITAFTVSFLFGLAIHYLKGPAVIGILALGIFILIRNHGIHKKREQEVSHYDIFNLKKVKDGKYAVKTTFEHAGIFLREVATSLSTGYDGLVAQNRNLLKNVRKNTKKFQEWSNIIVANVFKTLRLLKKEEHATTQKYAQTITALQEIAECHRDVIIRAYEHIDNNHKGILPVQAEEIKQVKDTVIHLLEITSEALLKQQLPDFILVEEHNTKLLEMLLAFDRNQVIRIQKDQSKTRLSILFYGFTRGYRMIAEQCIQLLQIFKESFDLNHHQPGHD